MTPDEGTSHVHGCEHEGCGLGGHRLRKWMAGDDWISVYYCVNHMPPLETLGRPKTPDSKLKEVISLVLVAAVVLWFTFVVVSEVISGWGDTEGYKTRNDPGLCHAVDDC